MKKRYFAPATEICRVFLEENIAAKASIIVIGDGGKIQQYDWGAPSDDIVLGAGTDVQGNLNVYDNY